MASAPFVLVAPPLVRPVTTYCIACKEDAEENERRFSGAEEAPESPA